MSLKNYWMSNMKIEYVAPLVISNCIKFLNDRPPYTKYHPGNNEFVLDGKIISKIIRHDGNFKAKTTVDEVNFFNRMLKHVIDDGGIVYSVLNNNEYLVEEYSKFGEFSVKVSKVIKTRKLRGRKPKYIGGNNNVTMGHSKNATPNYE